MSTSRSVSLSFLRSVSLVFCSFWLSWERHRRFVWCTVTVVPSQIQYCVFVKGKKKIKTWSWCLLIPEIHMWVCSPLLVPYTQQTLGFPTWRSVAVFSGARGSDTKWGWVLLEPAETTEGGWPPGLQSNAGVPLSGYHYGLWEASERGWPGSLGSSLWCHLVGRGKDILLNLESRNYFQRDKWKMQIVNCEQKNDSIQ